MDIVKEINEYFELEAHRNLITAVRSKLGEEFSKKITEHLTEYGRQLTFKNSVKAFKKVFKGCNTHKFVLINVNGGDDDIEVIGNGDTIMGVVYSLAIKQAHVLDSNDKYKKKTIAEYCTRPDKQSGVKKAPMHTINPLSQPPKPEHKQEYKIDDNGENVSIMFKPLSPRITGIEIANQNKTTKTTSPNNTKTTKSILDIDLEEYIKKSDYDDDDESYGLYHTEEDKMRIINEAKKKKRRSGKSRESRTSSGSSGDESVQQANTVQPVQPVQQANTIQQVVEPTMQLTLSTLSMQSPHLSDNQAEHLEYVQGLLEQIMNRDKASKVMKVITGIITHVDSALTINIKNKFVMRRKVDSFMAEIEKQYNLMIDIFVNLLKYAAKNNDYHAHSAIFDLIVEIREKINKLSERVRGCVRILEMQSKINELSEEYFIKYEQNKDINLLDQYRKL